MMVLRDFQDCACAAAVLPSCPPTTQHRSIDLEDVGKLWADWGIHGLILVSFGLQVFLLFAAGLRRCSTSRSLRSLLWLAYLSADTVAIFILGHLSIHASGPRHQLLFLWAPLVLLHLGGQHTITAFSMQDNELWRRHLLGLVTQVVLAGYVVSRSSWFDRRLLAAMVLMFLSGCLRYAERTCCLYNASPEKLKESSLAALKKGYTEKFKQGYNEDTDYQLIIDEMLKADGRHLPLHSRDEISSSANTLISETPLSDLATTKASPTSIQRNLKELKSSAHSCRAYNYVSTRLVHIYELLYTKAPFRYIIIDKLEYILNSSHVPAYEKFPTRQFTICALYFLMVFILFSTSATLVHFVVVAKKSHQLYSQADVIVSYILLIGAITLEVASLFIFFPFSPDPHGIQNAVWSVGKYIHLACGTKQWSEMLGQYNMINSLTKQDDANLMSFVPQWIRKHLDDKTITHFRIYEDLKKFVLDKLLEFGTRPEEWNFADYRGEKALGTWNGSKGQLVSSQWLKTPLSMSIKDVDFPTSVLIWHIATDILYFKDSNTNRTNSCQQMKKMSREISNYIMYLVFKCGVMLTNTSELQHNFALEVMKAERNLGEKDAMAKVFRANKLEEIIMRGSIHSSLPHACKVAEELINIHIEAKRWYFITNVWLEMLFHIAPRCGGAFHSEHLATGGEFITHVLLLMQLLGPFVRPPGTFLKHKFAPP